MPAVTKAAVCFGVNQPLELVELDVADPGPGEVMIRLIATGLCHSDLHVMEGTMPYSFPVVLGHEGIGEVIALGPGVTEFALGDRVMPFVVPDCGECVFCKSGRTKVCTAAAARRQANKTPFSLNGQPIASFSGLGTFAETTVVATSMLIKIDRAARPDHACCIACGVTTGLGAALITAKITPGASVVVFGAGGVGLSVIQGARLAGAERIIAVDTNPRKAEVAVKLGATEFINPRELDNVVAHIIKLTGMGADYAFDCVGLPELAAQAVDCTNPAWGLTVCVGVIPAGQALTLNPFSLLTGRHVTGSMMGGAKRKDVARFVDMYVSGKYNLDDLISHKLKHEEINRGFEMMRSGESVRSVITYGP